MSSGPGADPVGAVHTVARCAVLAARTLRTGGVVMR